MEALLHPRSVMELLPKPIHSLICVAWLEMLSKCHFHDAEQMPKIIRLHFVRDEVMSL